ncbi:unnamed protein product, partial [Ascophyllum nodosum]
LIAQGCPRGSKQLIGPFSSLFGPADAAAWFRERGVALKTEGDGRMFPQSDDSQTIIDCLQGKRIYAISCDYVLQATGAARGGHVWAKQLGHAVSPAVPSLFTLTVKDPR